MPVIHHDRDGRPRCGARSKNGPVPLAAGLEQVTCKACIRRADVRPCGTPAAYQRHLANKEPVDDACREAGRADSHARYAARAVAMGRPGQVRGPLQPCGTKAAYERHRLRGEDCPVCRPHRELAPCGSWGAYKRHLRRKQRCDVCQNAMRERWRSDPRSRRRAALNRHRARRRACRRYLASEARAKAAALTVCDRAADASEASELLQMLGLKERSLDSLTRAHGPLIFSRPPKETFSTRMPALMEAA